MSKKCKKNKKQPVAINERSKGSVESPIIRKVESTDTWCCFKKAQQGKYPYGLVLACKRPSDTKALANILGRELKGYIVRTKLIDKLFHMQLIIPASSYGSEYFINSFERDGAKHRKERVINVQNASYSKRMDKRIKNPNQRN